MLKTFKALITTLSALTVSTACVNAQTFVPSTAVEFEFSDPAVTRPTHTSCYSAKGVNTGFGQVDLYLAGWSTPTSGTQSEFTWLFTNPSDPATLVSKGSFLYNDAADIEVALVGTQILVAYYKLGVGHMVDVYDLTSATINPIVYNTTITLSTSPWYGPIQMDGLKAGVAVIAWANPGVGVQTIVDDGGTWGTVTTLSGTSNERALDVAISKTSSTGATVHYVYYDPAIGVITECQVPYNSLLAPPPTITPTINDDNHIGLASAGTFNLVLDCPDSYDVDNWAYTYADNLTDISVRFMDHHTSTSPATVIVNSAAVTGVPTTGYKVFSPALHYGTGSYGSGNGDQIYVGWYISDGAAYNGYVGLHMNENATALLSANDYMELPHAITPTSYPFIDVLGAGLAFSKVSYGGTVPDFMYTTFYDYNGSNYNLHHAFHKWGDPLFRPAGPQSAPLVSLETQLHTSPNPFSDALNTTIDLKEGGVVQFKMYDMTGRVVWQYRSSLPQGLHHLKMDNVKDIVPGTYILATFLNDAKIGSQTMVKK